MDKLKSTLNYINRFDLLGSSAQQAKFKKKKKKRRNWRCKLCQQQAKGEVNGNLHRRNNKRGSITATTITSNQAVNPSSKPESKITGSQLFAFSKPCLFSQGVGHSMEQCRKMKKAFHQQNKLKGFSCSVRVTRVNCVRRT